MMIKTKNINIKVWVGGKINRPGQVTPPSFYQLVSTFPTLKTSLQDLFCYFNSIFFYMQMLCIENIVIIGWGAR